MTDKLDNAKAQGQAQFDSIREMVEALRKAEADRGESTYRGMDDEARDRILEDALSVEVRSDWHSVEQGTARPTLTVPAEYRILLCTGGPACQIVGELSEHGEPETARLQVQDWFMPWTDMRPQVGPDDFDSEPILLEYARCFYFGE